MRTKLLSVVFFGTLVATCSAQNGQLSLGLSTSYHRGGIVGAGGPLDYRSRPRSGWEFIGEVSVMRYWWLQGEYDPDDDARTFYFVGIGPGYRDSTGMHVGLLGGGVALWEEINRDETRFRFIPGIAVTLGTGIGRRTDLSIDAWLAGETTEDIVFLPMLRFSYRLCGKDRAPA